MAVHRRVKTRFTKDQVAKERSHRDSRPRAKSPKVGSVSHKAGSAVGKAIKSDATATLCLQSILGCSLSRYYGRTIEGELKTLLPMVPVSPISALHADLPANVVREYLLLQDIWKKYPGIPGTTLEQRLSKAESVWMQCEDDCRATNEKLRDNPDVLTTEGGFDNPCSRTLSLARQIVLDVLEEAPNSETLYGSGRHGPGGSIGCNGNATTPYFKASSFPITVTESAVPYLRLRVAKDPYWFCAGVSQLLGYHFSVIPPYNVRLRILKDMSEQFFRIVPGNKRIFVPKDASVERPISIEPLGNLFLQLGVDEYIRDRLTIIGVDLDTQERNQSLALLGSSDPSWDSPVTIDLSSASDRISIGIAKWILPPLWFAFLQDLRSPVGSFNDTEWSYEKFSSMGNGFTFALESLIFVAIARASTIVSNGKLNNVHIHGDDIIVPKNAALLCCEALERCGFRINVQKSYFFGPFRESCGVDGWNGTDVRVIRVKDEFKDVRCVFRLLNWFRKQVGLFGDSHFVQHYDRIYQLLTPDQRKLVGPAVEDDGHIHQSETLCLSTSRYSRRRQYLYYSTIIDVANRYDRSLRKSKKYNSWAHGWSFLYQSQKSDTDEETSKDAVSITKRASTRTRLVTMPLHGKPTVPMLLRQTVLTDYLLNA